jgi:CrcB protein
VTAAARPDHLRAGPIAVVAAGGAVGTALRAGIGLLAHPVSGFPIAIFGVNIIGAFALGVLLQALAVRGPDTGRRRTLRLLLGTGVLGGFTTYSALSSDSAVLLTTGGFGLALAYGFATVLLGTLASWAGIALGTIAGARRGSTAGPDSPGSSGDAPGRGPTGGAR